MQCWKYVTHLRQNAAVFIGCMLAATAIAAAASQSDQRALQNESQRSIATPQDAQGILDFLETMSDVPAAEEQSGINMLAVCCKTSSGACAVFSGGVCPADTASTECPCAPAM